MGLGMKEHVRHWNVGLGWPKVAQAEYDPLSWALQRFLYGVGGIDWPGKGKAFFVGLDLWEDRTAMIEFVGESPDSPIWGRFVDEVVPGLQKILAKTLPTWRIAIGCTTKPRSPYNLYVYPDHTEIVDLIYADASDAAKAMKAGTYPDTFPVLENLDIVALTEIWRRLWDGEAARRSGVEVEKDPSAVRAEEARSHVQRWSAGPGYPEPTDEEFAPLLRTTQGFLQGFSDPDKPGEGKLFYVVPDVWMDRTAKVEFKGESAESPLRGRFANEIVPGLQKVLAMMLPSWRIAIGFTGGPERRYGMFLYSDRAEVVTKRCGRFIVTDMDIANLTELWSSSWREKWGDQYFYSE